MAPCGTLPGHWWCVVSPRSGVGAQAARLHIDWTRCDGRGLCVELLPEALRRDAWGYPVLNPDRVTVPGDRSNVPISEAEHGNAVEAVKLCPLLALRLTRPQPDPDPTVTRP